jgi:hypothetical protein
VGADAVIGAEGGGEFGGGHFLRGQIESGGEVTAQDLRYAAEDHSVLGLVAERFERQAGLNFGGDDNRWFGAEEEPEEEAEEDESEDGQENDGGGMLFPV